MSGFFSNGGFVVDLILIAIILAFALRGYKKKMTDIVFGLLCTLVAIVVALLFYKLVGTILIQNTQLDESISNGIYNVFEKNGFQNLDKISTENTNMPESVVKVINNYLVEATRASVENSFKYVSDQISDVIVNFIAFILTLIIVRIILGFCKFFIDIIAKLPILNEINSLGGLAFGFCEGFIFIYIMFTVMSVLSPLYAQSGILTVIQSSAVGGFLFNNNIILNLIAK